MCQKCIFLVIIKGSVYVSAESFHREYGGKHLVARSASNSSVEVSSVGHTAPRGPPTSSPSTPPPATAFQLTPALRMTIMVSVLTFGMLLLLLCVLNVCAASPDCCPFEPGALVDSDYSSESLAYARWIDAPRTCVQRCARTFTRLFFPLRAHAFYLPSRSEFDTETIYGNPWPARMRALLFLSGGRDFPSLPPFPSPASTPQIFSSPSSHSLSGDSGGMSGSASSPESPIPRKRIRRHLQYYHSEDERPSRWSGFSSLGLPKTLFANSSGISDKLLLKRLQRLERRLSRSERRALRQEERERQMEGSTSNSNPYYTKHSDRHTRRREKEKKKYETKLRKREKKERGKRNHLEKLNESPPGSPVATTSTGGRGIPLVEVFAPTKEISLSSSSDNESRDRPLHDNPAPSPASSESSRRQYLRILSNNTEAAVFS